MVLLSLYDSRLLQNPEAGEDFVLITVSRITVAAERDR